VGGAGSALGRVASETRSATTKSADSALTTPSASLRRATVWRAAKALGSRSSEGAALGSNCCGVESACVDSDDGGEGGGASARGASVSTAPIVSASTSSTSSRAGGCAEAVGELRRVGGLGGAGVRREGGAS